MNRYTLARTTLLVALLVYIAGPLGARAQAEPPDVHTDGRVTFSLKAPEARDVALFSWELRAFSEETTVPMTLEADSVWRVTLGPLPPGVYDYWFDMDGLRITDPMGRNVFGQRLGARDYFEIPGPEGTPRHDEWRDVSHGAVAIHWYPSTTVGEHRRLHVYTPPGYFENPDRTYPVLYLLHGGGDDDGIWPTLGRANVILDNLIADGKAVPMVLVMPDGMPTVVGEGDRNARRQQMHTVFEQDVLDELIPYVEARYRIHADRDGRAIAGLSMGGGQSLRIGLGHLDGFAWIGGFSSSTFGLDPVLDPLAARTEQVNEQLQLLWLAIGEDDFLLERHTQFVQRLGELGIDHEYHETEGYHMWSVWRGYLAAFAPRLWHE